LSRPCGSTRRWCSAWPAISCAITRRPRSWRRFAEIQSRDHLRYWLRKVASRRCIDQTRRRKFRTHLSLEETVEPFSWMPAEDPLLKRYIEQLLGKLAETPRMIVILRYQEGMEPSEIAELLEMPLNTVKSHLQRSLALLRQKLSFTAKEGSHDGV
jgi:RNA polymerase sigma-70 factor (ECF subfamily)